MPRRNLWPEGQQEELQLPDHLDPCPPWPLRAGRKEDLSRQLPSAPQLLLALPLHLGPSSSQAQVAVTAP